MKNWPLLLGAVGMFWFAAGCRRPENKIPEPDYWPTKEWRTSTPEQQGMDAGALADAIDQARQRGLNIHSLLLVRNGYVVCDAVFYPYARGLPHDVASVTKSVTSTLIGCALDQGLVSGVQQQVLGFFTNLPATNRDARKDRLQVKHLLTMTSGLDCGFEPREARLFQMKESQDWVKFMLDLPMVAEPGSRFGYCSGNFHLLSAIVSGVSGKSALEFARENLFAPLGIQEANWPADPSGINHGWGDLQLHPHDMARLGLLFLHHGKWDGKQVLSANWVTQATRKHVNLGGGQGEYGYGWWLHTKDFPGLYEARGRGGQRIIVWPEQNLILVFTGGGFEPGDIARHLLHALKSNQPLPANPAACERLDKAIEQAAQPPSPSSARPLPELAGKISGKTFALEGNWLRLDALSLRFDQSAEATASFFALGKQITLPVGLDGVYRFSTNSLSNLPVAAKGEWTTDNQFVFELNTVAAINCLRLTLLFEAGKLKVTVKEVTGLVDESFGGKPRD